MKSEKLYLRQIQAGPMENFIYLIGDSEKKECVMVDPAWEVGEILKIAAADGMKVTAGLATHYHYDHTNGIAELASRAACPVYIHKADIPYLQKEHIGETKPVESGSKLEIGDITITFIHTPGHTPGSQCFLVNNKLVSGDTLFINACGRCDLPGGDSGQLYQSLQRLAKLDDGTILLPGHNYADETSSTIGREKRLNPYYQIDSMQDFIAGRMRPRRG